MISKSTLKAVEKALKTIKQLGTVYKDGHWQDITVSPTVIILEERLIISAEDGNGFVDYYGEFRGGYPYIDPRIEHIAKQYGCYWEWENPGSIVLTD